MPTDLSVDRRKFVQGVTGALGGVIGAMSPLAALVPTRAWAVEMRVLTSAQAATLAAVIHTIAPHDGLDEAAYALVVGALDKDAAASPEAGHQMTAGLASLGADFHEAVEAERVRRLQAVESSGFFQAVRGKTLLVLYSNPIAWAHFGYEGEAFSKGGYLNRGFNEPALVAGRSARGQRSDAGLMTGLPSNDEASVVVIIGSGAGGGTLAHELTRRGIKVVLLEAGGRQSLATFSQVPGEAFGQLTWLDPRTQSGDWGPVKDFPTLPVWHCKTVGGTTVHWTGATPRLQPYEMRARSTYGAVPGTSLIDWPIEHQELLPWYELAEKRMGVTRRNGVPGLPAATISA